MFLSILLIFFGVLFCVYDFVLIILNPGTILDILTSFTNIWLFFGGILIFLGVFKIKTKKSFWNILTKKVKIIIICVFSIGFLISTISLCFILNPKITKMNEESDFVILLGGGIDKDGNLPESVLNRVLKTSEYLKIHKNTICVVTGGTLKWLPFAEAPEIKRQLISQGIEKNRILVEDQALDTIQNLQLSCELLSKTQGISKKQVLNSKITIITTFFHLRRAERLAKRMGFTDFQGIGSNCSPIVVPHSYLREICSYIKLNLRILFTNKPQKIE